MLYCAKLVVVLQLNKENLCHDSDANSWHFGPMIEIDDDTIVADHCGHLSTGKKAKQQIMSYVCL